MTKAGLSLRKAEPKYWTISISISILISKWVDCDNVGTLRNRTDECLNPFSLLNVNAEKQVHLIPLDLAPLFVF